MDQQRKSNWMDEANFSDHDTNSSPMHERDSTTGAAQDVADRSAKHEHDRHAAGKDSSEESQHNSAGSMPSSGKGPGKPGTE